MESNELIAQASQLLALSEKELIKRPDEKSWNVLECFEHMNQYHTFYLPEIAKKIAASKYPATAEFNSGWFGNYAAKSMLPKKEGKVNLAMKTFPDMDPIGQSLAPKVIDLFIAQLKELTKLIELSRKVDLRKTQCKLTIKWLKFTLGDTLHFMINHNRRHMIQIQRILAVER